MSFSSVKKLLKGQNRQIELDSDSRNRLALPYDAKHFEACTAYQEINRPHICHDK